MKINLKIWRQTSSETTGNFETYVVENVSEDMSFFEVLDMLNNSLIKENKSPIAFDHDCREGICGTCGIFINGRAHGPLKGITTCQLHMRSFRDGETITLEPFRAKAFPILKDLIVNRTSFDRIIQAGGYVSVKTGSAQDGNAIPIGKHIADEAFDAAACIGCGACVATCKNSSAMLFVAAKINHLNNLPQGKIENKRRVINMITQMDKEGFGSCSNTYECEAVCPKEIKASNIAKMNFNFIKSSLF